VEKCKFGKTSIEFLGHIISTASIAPLPSRVVAIATHPRPSTIKDPQNFLGLVNFYRNFVPGAAAMLSPLADALMGSLKSKATVEWTAGQGRTGEGNQPSLPPLRGQAGTDG
jgi:hypothetical protein